MEDKVSEFQVSEILPLVLVLGVATIGVVYVIDILADVQDDEGNKVCSHRTDTFTNYNETANVCYNSSGTIQQPGAAEFNSTASGIAAIAKFPEKFGIIATIIVAVILIGMLTRYLMVR